MGFRVRYYFQRRCIKHMFFKHTGIQFRIYPKNSISTPVSFWGWYTYSFFRIPAWSWLLRFRDRWCSFVGIRYHWLLMFFLFTSHGTLSYPTISQGFTNLERAQSLKYLLELMIFPFQRWDLSWFPALEGNVIHRHTFLREFSWIFQKPRSKSKIRKGCWLKWLLRLHPCATYCWWKKSG